MTELNIVRRLMQRAEFLGVGGEVALEMGGRRVTYEELYCEVRCAEVRFRELGVVPGDRVAIQLPKSLQLVFFHLGALLHGAAVVPVNDRATVAETAFLLNDSGAVALVTDRVRWAASGGSPVGAQRAFEPPRWVLIVDGDQVTLAEGGGSGSSGSRGDGTRTRGCTKSCVPGAALICYTSGTTGKPKGAMITHENLVVNMDALHEAWRWRESDVLLHTLPLFHIHGLLVALHGALNAGSRTTMLPHFYPRVVIETLESGAFTLFMGVPTMYHRLVETWQARGYGGWRREGSSGAATGRRPPGLASMRLFVSGSAPLPEALFHRFQRITGHTILERYGMTETGIIASNPYPVAERRPGSVGFPLPRMALRVVDREGREAPSGDVGEVQVAGKHVFSGYYGAPETTAAAFRGEKGTHPSALAEKGTDPSRQRWFTTGDMGFRDPGDSGRLYLLGRAKELIISGGFNIYPLEVEARLMEHPGVAEAAVVGLPDSDLGERVAAAVVPTSDHPPVDGDRLIAFCREHLAAYKCPRTIELLDALPRNAMGKVQKEVLCRVLSSCC